jgi:hypothetical protein
VSTPPDGQPAAFSLLLQSVRFRRRREIYPPDAERGMLSAAMAQRRHHYERAFEAFLRARRVPYVAVDEAKRALLPESGAPGIRFTSGPGTEDLAIKSFDFVIYGEQGAGNLLIDVKGRRVGSGKSGNGRLTTGRLESWVTLADIQSLEAWERLFGPGFSAAFVFMYWCEAQPPDALFQEIFEHHGVWYALRSVTLSDYKAAYKTRSERWGTVDLPRAAFERLSRPFASARETYGRNGDQSLFLHVPDAGPEVPALTPW